MQQKQQKHRSSEVQSIKDSSKISLFLKKPFLQPIKTRSSSRSKIQHNIQQLSTQKKIKVPDIYYELPPETPNKKQLNTIITERDSLKELQLDLEPVRQQKQQTKSLINTKPQQNQMDHPQICKNQPQGLDKRLSQPSLNHKNSKNRYCCQTQPFEQASNYNMKNKKRNDPHHNSLPQTTKNLPNKILPQKLKPIKTNFYQKPQLFGPVPQKLLPSIDRSQFQRYFISKNQEKQIIDKLSKPKHQHECVKKNCQCFNESRLTNSGSAQNRGLTSFDLKQLETKKLKVNIEKLKKLNASDCPEVEQQCFGYGLKHKIQQKINYKKKKNLGSLKRFDTQPFESEKFIYDNEKVKNQNYASSECCEQRKNAFSASKQKDDQESFITGILTPPKTKMDRIKERKIQEQKDDGFQPEKPQKVSINIQTQDVLIERNEESLKINSTKALKPSSVQKRQVDQEFNSLDRKKSTLSHSCIKDLQNIGYTFGSCENSARKLVAKESLESSQIKEYYTGKTKDEIIECLSFERQYWVYYEIEKYIFHDLTKPIGKIVTVPPKSKINLVSSVFKEDIISKVPAKQQKPTEKQSLDISQISSIPNLEKLNSIPITIDIKDIKKNELPQTNSSVISKSRNTQSPILVKSHINMFNRSPKSMVSSRARRGFKIPKESQYVDFVKNYKPINPQIQIPAFIQQNNFKVIPSTSKFFFGQTIEESIKHGQGIEITFNQIFEGQYVDGNRKKGYLKVHDGVYQGTFENNLKHGHGTFRWDNGQVFEGQWKMGTKNGFGIWTSPDGSYYEGQWHLNMQHGKGKHVHSSCIYQGTFKNFRKQGLGKESFPNGDKFIGEYKNGKPNGKGKYEWSNGTFYQGEFADGLKEGKGTWHEDANTYYEGSFFKDQKHGQGIEYYKDGSYLQGQFVKGSIWQGKHYNVNKKVIKTISAEVQQNF